MVRLVAERLRELIHYDPETGVFTWRSARSGRSQGRVAGSVGRGGRWIRVDNRLYKSNQLAYLYMTGEWPPFVVDHENGDPIDDRWSNLRPATYAQNAWNSRTPIHNTSGLKGVSRRGNRWRSYITVSGQRINLGCFDTAEEAHATYCRAAEFYHKEFARTN